MNIKTLATALIMGATAFDYAAPAFAGANEDAVLSILNSYRPGSTGFGAIKVESVKIDNKKKSIEIACNEKFGLSAPYV